MIATRADDVPSTKLILENNVKGSRAVLSRPPRTHPVTRTTDSPTHRRMVVGTTTIGFTPMILLTYSFTILLAPSTSPSVIAAITISPHAPTINGRSPCFLISLKLIRRPTPANVSRNAQRDKFARL